MKDYLTDIFQIKDLRLLCYFLCIEVAHDRRKIVLSHRNYVLEKNVKSNGDDRFVHLDKRDISVQ